MTHSSSERENLGSSPVASKEHSVAIMSPGVVPAPSSLPAAYDYDCDDEDGDLVFEADAEYDDSDTDYSMPLVCDEIEFDATQSPAKTEELFGVVMKISCHNPKSGFLVARVKVRGERRAVTVKGYAQSVMVGECLICTGGWENDPVFGRQFKSYSTKVVAKDSTEALELLPKLVELSGTVVRISRHNKETGFVVAKLKVKGERKQVTVTGRVPSLIVGECMVCSGDWVNDPIHGQQFEAQTVRVVAPDSIEGLEKYLGSGLIRHIGPGLAKRLTAKFGSEVLEVIENRPEELLSVSGISKKKLGQITASWNSAVGMKALVDFLRTYAIDASKALKVHQIYGENAIGTITVNPYRLFYDINGFDFRTADEIALRMGFAHDSMLRIQAGVRHAVREVVAKGHCAWPMDSLAEIVARDLNVGLELAKNAVSSDVQSGFLIKDEVGGQAAVYRSDLYYSETGVANYLLRLLDGKPSWDLDLEQVIPWAEGRTGTKLTASQRLAVEMALVNKVTVITGGPGVGKTTIVNLILQIILSTGAEVTTCAPTGRAAKRMSEATKLESRTIHRLLGVDSFKGEFKHNRHNQLITDYVVIDEASMVDVSLMFSLLAAIPDHAGLLIIGDVDQLPSVGPGAVLMDIIASDRIPTARLTEILRQKEGSKIVENAHQINMGQPLILSKTQACDFFYINVQDSEQILKKTVDVVTEGVPRLYGFDPISEIQVLTPMNEGLLGSHTLNAELQKKLNTSTGDTLVRNDTLYAVGDKVIQVRINNYEKNVLNGDTGIIRVISKDSGIVTIEFDGRLVDYTFAEMDDIMLSYATTVHKSQGSEYPCVVIPLGMEHNALLERNMLYTAVTRGKRLVIVIGQQKAVSEATSRNNSPKRQTKLAFRLNTMY